MEIIVNGATGWLGRSTIFAARKVCDFQDPIIKCISSKSRLLLIDGLEDYKTVTFDQYLATNVIRPDIYVHLPFKTKDYQNAFSPDNYKNINGKLIDQGLQIVSQNRPKSVVIVSSGVVGRFYATNGIQDNDLYTEMKILEENNFRTLCSDLGINLVTLRLWGASGSLMTEPLKYAIGNLISQALEGPEISIESRNLVYRRYVDAAEAMAVSLYAAINGFSGVLDSGGTIVEMSTLVAEIMSSLGISKPVNRPDTSGGAPDLYFSTSTAFEDLAINFGLKISSLDLQIKETKKAVLRSLA